ncbi:MAG TPA: DUF4352 domain-containing protein [Chryseolinea sp.]|nr:DUF4352 domain-containing protein [Chryseolinea sp.]
MEQNAPVEPWYNKTWLVVLLYFFFFPVGLYALWKSTKIAVGWKIVWTTLILVIFIPALFADKQRGSNNSNYSPAGANEPATEASATASVGIGQVMHTDYFDVIVNKATIQESVNTGNQFTDLEPETGILYLVINASFKNTDNESRMILDGSVWVNYNGKKYEFDKSETIMQEGWGLLLDQINPLITKTTNLVYKISTEIKGPAYYQPGRANNDQLILLGQL